LYGLSSAVRSIVDMKKVFTSCNGATLGLLLLAASGIQTLRGADSFTRITSGPAVSGANCSVLAWGDFNNDGYQDLYVTPLTGNSLLYSNNGNGTFTQILNGPVPSDSGPCFGATWADYDNDGGLDLFVGVNSSRSDWLYHNNGLGGFTKITTGAIVNSGGNANNCGWADYDNDGFIDLFVANSDQNDFFYHNNGDGTFTRIMTNAIATKTGNSQGGSWADYDNDGWPDLFVSRVNEPNLLYHNEGNGVFTPVTNGIIVHDIGVGQGTSWGDYDNDGYLDLFVVNPNLRNFLYRNNGDGTFTKITNGPVVNDIGNGHGCAWADYDNDGYLDLFVANRLGANFLYHNYGDGTFTRVTTGVIPTDAADAVSGAWADYDNDGFQDLFVTELNSFNNRLYHNNGNSNGWLTIKLEGRLSNRAAIGAKVRVKATIGGSSFWQMREISGGGGLGSQNDLRAAFGLGDATNADIVRIEWPSRMVQQFTNVAARQFLTFIEPSASITPSSINAAMGTNVAFAVQSDLDPPLELQWRFNGVPIPGETNLTLTITNLQRENAGLYSVSLTNNLTGLSYTTPPATLTGPLALLQQPISQNVRVGSNAIFSVIATGAPPLFFQWQRGGTNLPGETNFSLTLRNVQIADEGFYSATVSNSYGTLSTSNATLVAWIRPLVITSPLSQSVVAGGTLVLSATATGYPMPLTFRWLNGNSILSTVTLNDTNCFLAITNIQAPAGTNQLFLKINVSNPAGAFTSGAAIITLLPDSDGDGLPDAWESAHGLNPNNAADAALDPDADGASNLQEYLAGTDPNQSASSLKIDGISWNPVGGIALQFSALSNKTYTVQSCSFLPGTPWIRVADIPATSTNRTMRISDPALSPGEPRFYRLVTPRTN